MNFRGRLLLCVVSNFVLGDRSECGKPEMRLFTSGRLKCDRNNVREIDFFKTAQKTAVSVLENKEGKKFVVKQKAKNGIRRHISVARDMLGVHLARSIGVYANAAEIIPAFYEFPGKRDMRFPATLHTFVPGVQVCKLPSSLSKFDVEIKQVVKEGVSKTKCGLNRRLIYNMSKHEGLSKLVALDTFIANGDRNRKNFFYDQTSARFYAIDFGSSFRKNVACYACDNIQSMIDDKREKFSEQELRALKIYRNTLSDLVSRYTAADLHKKMVIFAVQAGLVQEIVVFRSTAGDRLSLYKEVMIENYDSCKRLIALLGELIEKHDALRTMKFFEKYGEVR